MDPFQSHRSKNHISIDEYIRSKQIKLSRDISNKHAIYLDIRYWIILCEASLKRTKTQESYELLDKVIQIVDEDLAFFPISESIFFELMKQNDPVTRDQTIKLIDRFSMGVSLMPKETRVGTELAHILHADVFLDTTYSLNELIWTKTSNVLGSFIPSQTGYNTDAELLIQKGFFDHMWGLRLFEFLNSSEYKANTFTMNFDGLADQLNRDIAAHSQELRSYEQAYVNEISGALECYSPVVNKILNQIAVRDGVSESIGIDAGKVLMNVFKESYRKGIINKSAPSIDIIARCYASVRWNKGRQLEANDIYDFNHAASALGYCTAFFTERSLCNLLTEKKIALEKVHDCVILHKIKDVFLYLRNKYN